MLNDEIISTLEKTFETFSESIERRVLNIEEQIIGARDSHWENKYDNSDNTFCLNLLKNRISELERQIIEKDAVKIFLSNQLFNKNLNGDSGVNETVNDHNKFSRERQLIILLIITSLWFNIMIIIKKKKVTSS